MTTKFKEYTKSETYEIPNISGKSMYKTSIPPAKRSFKNLPRNSSNKPQVHWRHWLMVKAEKMGYGKSAATGEWYGWSHRAVHGFKPGDRIKGDNLGKKIILGPDFTIKDENHAKKVAIQFHRNVA